MKLITLAQKVLEDDESREYAKNLFDQIEEDTGDIWI